MDEFLKAAEELSLPSGEANFLECVHRRLYILDRIAYMVDLTYAAMNRLHFVDKMLSGGRRDLPATVYDLNMTKIQEIFLPKVRTRVQVQGIRYIIAGQSLNQLWASAFASRDGHSTLQVPQRIRPVYLVLEKIASKNRSSNRIGQLFPILQLLPDQLRHFFRMATTEHWGIVVGECPTQIGTHGLQTLHDNTSPASENPEMTVLRLELVREGFVTEISASYPTVTECLEYRLMPIGCTFLPNEAIKRKGKQQTVLSNQFQIRNG